MHLHKLCDIKKDYHHFQVTLKGSGIQNKIEGFLKREKQYKENNLQHQQQCQTTVGITLGPNSHSKLKLIGGERPQAVETLWFTSHADPRLAGHVLGCPKYGGLHP